MSPSHLIVSRARLATDMPSALFLLKWSLICGALHSMDEATHPRLMAARSMARERRAWGEGDGDEGGKALQGSGERQARYYIALHCLSRNSQ